MTAAAIHAPDCECPICSEAAHDAALIERTAYRIAGYIERTATRAVSRHTADSFRACAVMIRRGDWRGPPS